MKYLSILLALVIIGCNNPITKDWADVTIITNCSCTKGGDAARVSITMDGEPVGQIGTHDAETFAIPYNSLLLVRFNCSGTLSNSTNHTWHILIADNDTTVYIDN